MKTKSSNILGLGTLLLLTGSAHSALVVHEGFDYTEGSALSGSGTGTGGWGGSWTGGNWDVISGQSFGTLEASGGAVQRPSRSGNAATSRTISAGSRGLLTGDGSTIWFSVVVQATGSPAADVGGTAGFPLNTNGTLVFGDTALTGGSGTGPAPIGTGGNAIGLGFRGSSAGFPSVELQGVTYSNGAVTTSGLNVITVGENSTLIVGSVDWAATGNNDTLTLYQITDPSAAALPAAFATLTADLNQSTFNVVSIGDAQTSIYDEIRIGTDLAGVTPGLALTGVPEPSSASLAALAALGLLRRRRI